MPTKAEWTHIRTEYEAGASFSQCGLKFNLGEKTVRARAEREGWARNKEGEVIPRGPGSEERQANAVAQAKRENALEILLQYRGASVRFRKLVTEYLTEAEMLMEAMQSIDAQQSINAALDGAPPDIVVAVNRALSHNSRIEALNKLLSSFNTSMQVEKGLVELALAAQAQQSTGEDVPTLSVAEYEAVQKKHAELLARIGAPKPVTDGTG